eukprot:TRINITY_DN26064_c0_g6_i1.p1 TRINITY_DN26064_c0_g6~~TRINITY_DN26064_c0_g6_i1.p1  ORF type:complete len:573 (+),score=112.20 TRINITY_DN26064_c0_g6_i1:116-1720(+)
MAPHLEYIDRAVAWAEEYGLQVVLDLHGCPGGESGEAPCGRRRRPEGTWKWRHWQFDATLEVLEILAKRYCSRTCVTGITVCNEPSGTVPGWKLSEYYNAAVDVVRKAGMSAERVSVVLPVFQRNEDDFIEEFYASGGQRHENICFDLHCYHCFENEFHGKSLAEHLRHAEINADWLQKYPIVVGEWSLALGGAAWNTCGELSERMVYKMFAAAQVEAYNKASHGHFFWNWWERAEDIEWNFQAALREGLLSGPVLRAPRWNGEGEDPLEAILHPDPPEPRVLLGEAIYLRVFHGRYVNADGSFMRAQWSDKGEWQRLTFHDASESSSTGRRRGAGPREVHDGMEVRIQDYSGRFLHADAEGKLRSTRQKHGTGPRGVFVVHVESGGVLRHRGGLYLWNKATQKMLDADEEEDGLFLRWEERGHWQRLRADKRHASREDLSAAGGVAAFPAFGAEAGEDLSAVETPARKGRKAALTVEVSPSAAAAGAAGSPTSAPKQNRKRAASEAPAAEGPGKKSDVAAGSPWPAKLAKVGA